MRGARAARPARPHAEPAGYRLGLRFVEYGHLATERTAVGDRGLPLLVELRNALGETVQIGVPAGADVVYVERVEGGRRCATRRNSRRSPSIAPAPARSSPAFIPEVVEARLRAGLPPSTGYTIVVPECSWPSWPRSASAGYARSVDETELGMSSLAVPVHGPPDGPVVAAISMVGPTARVIGEHETRHIDLLQAGARKLSEAIGKGEYALKRRSR